MCDRSINFNNSCEKATESLTTSARGESMELHCRRSVHNIQVNLENEIKIMLIRLILILNQQKLRGRHFPCTHEM